MSEDKKRKKSMAEQVRESLTDKYGKKK